METGFSCVWRSPDYVMIFMAYYNFYPNLTKK